MSARYINNDYYVTSSFCHQETGFNLIKINKKKKKITFGRCSRFYLFILGAGSFKLLSLLILGANNIFENGIGLFGFCPVLYNYNFMQSIYMYIGFIIFGILLYFIKRDKSFETEEYKEETLQQNYKNKLAKDFSGNKIKMKIFFLSLAAVIHLETKKILYIEGFQFFNFWITEIIFMQILMRKFFTIDYYIHHKVSILFNVLVCSTILITASFLPTSLSNEIEGNAYDNINQKLGNYAYCILLILFFLFLSLVFCFTRIYSKVLMQYKFVSPYKLIFLFGITGLFVSAIYSWVAYSIDYHDNIVNYYYSLKSVLDEGKKYYFYGEIFLVYPTYSFSIAMEFTFEILTIYYLNPFYILMSNTLYYGITEFIFFVLNSSSDGLVIVHFILTECVEIIDNFGLLIYLEIVELNFCGLNKNLKRTIIEKGDDEFRALSLFNILEDENEEYEDNSDEESDNNKENRQFGDVNRYRNI